jgi:hypothetical protein
MRRKSARELATRGKLAGQVQWGGGSPSEWCSMEAMGAAIHGGGGAVVVTSSDGEVLQSEGEKRGEAHLKKKRGGDQSSELTGRRGWQ